MIYVLQDKYYEEGYYECKRNVCAFTSGYVAKEIEYILASYLHTYNKCIETPNGYFDVLKANKEEIISSFAKVLGNEAQAALLFKKLRIGRIHEWSTRWKEDGHWFKTVELSEF